MKKVVLSAIILLTASSAFAQHHRPCKAWRVRHHHRYCVKR